MDKIIDIFGKIQALGVWKNMLGSAWALKPMGMAFPYLLLPSQGAKHPELLHIRMLEGWKQFQNFVFLNSDPSFGCVERVDELTQFTVVRDGDGPLTAEWVELGYAPKKLNERQRELVFSMLWETYGIMLRAEQDSELMMRFADHRAIFGRQETKPGVWEDHAFEIPPPLPYSESVSFSKKELSQLKDAPFMKDMVVDVEFTRSNRYVTSNARPRNVYRMVVVDEATRRVIATAAASVGRDIGVHEIWEQMPIQFMRSLLQLKVVPGVVKVRSQRVFRLLRSLCMEVPFKLSLHDKLPVLESLPEF